jgi:hypothetical protein
MELTCGNFRRLSGLVAESSVPHRRGSFHEDWNELLHRFALRGTPAEFKDQLQEIDPKRKPRRRSPSFDPHRELLERSKG